MNKRGQATILFLAFLTILALTVVVLWLFNRIQSGMSSPYIDQFRARVLAQMGIERALAEFQKDPYIYFIRNNTPPWFYWGEDLNHNNQLDSGEDQNGNHQLDTIECPGELALSPSFATGSLLNLLGKTIGYSASISRAGGTAVDLYSLKIIDTGSQIYLNGNGWGTIRLLNNLGKIIGLGDNLGERIIEVRQKLPNRSFTVKEQLKEVLGDADYRKVEPYVTAWGIPDAKVIKPKPFDQRPLPFHTGQDIIRLSQLNPGKLELEQRVPININTAPRAVLTAVLLELNGSYLGVSEVTNPALEGGLETPANHFNYDTPPVLRLGVVREVTIDRELAERLSDRIMKERLSESFLSWDDFYKFCDRLMSEGVFGPLSTGRERELARAKMDLVKANANPNTRLNKFNPNQLMVQLIDKSDLSVYTTEFCFQPAGYFEIESTGIVTRATTKAGASDGSGEFVISGLQKIRNIVKLFDSYYETNQQDFSRGTISRSGKNQFTHQNKTLQTYPEPDIDEYPEKCVADGQIMRATLQNHSRNKERNDLLTFQHHFDNGLKADYTTPSGNPLPVDETDATTGNSLKRPNQQDLFETVNPGSLYPDGVYSEALACPAYEAENNLYDAFTHEKHFGGKRFRGTITFWVKPNYLANSSKPRTILSLAKPGLPQPDPIYHYRVCQNLFNIFLFPPDYQPKSWLGIPSYPNPNLVWVIDLNQARYSEPVEYIFRNPLDQKQLTGWMHLGIAWDTNPPARLQSYDCPNCHGSGKIAWAEGEIVCPRCNGRGKITESKITPADVFAFCINGQDASTYVGTSQEKYPPLISEYLNLAHDNLIRLGERVSHPFWNAPADATFDEFTIQIHETTAKAKEFIINEFRTGRYYKGEGIFTSGLILPPASLISNKTSSDGSLKCRADWTVYYPAKDNQKSAPLEVQFFDEYDNPLSGLLANNRDAHFEIPPGGPVSKRIKYKVFFREKRTEISAPLLETAIFDDITITFIKPKPEVCESYLIP